MSRLAKNDIMGLSISERIQLVEDIWDSIASVPETLQLTEEQKWELDRRLDDYHNNPGKGSPWEVVRERIRTKVSTKVSGLQDCKLIGQISFYAGQIIAVSNPLTQATCC
jgi:putative addiction module component (TIGR02574 family)